MFPTHIELKLHTLQVYDTALMGKQIAKISLLHVHPPSLWLKLVHSEYLFHRFQVRTTGSLDMESHFCRRYQ